MLSENLLNELRKLSRVDKLRAMQVLVTELAAEEDPVLIVGETYELLTPYGNEAAAADLARVLEADRAKDG
jgi:hypothetical protein